METIAAAPGRSPLSAGWRILTIGLMTVVTAAAFEGLAVATVMPSAERELGHLSLYGWVFSAFNLAGLVGTVVFGHQADRRGPLRPLATALTLFAAGVAAGGLAPSMVALVAARAVQGFGAGAIAAMAYVTIGRAYPETARPRMMALLSTAWVVPGLIGPALAGFVAQHVSWRAAFLGVVPFTAAGAVATLPALGRALPSAPAGERAGRGPATSRAVRVAAGAGMVVAGLTGHVVWVDAPLVAGGVAVGLPAFVRLVPAGTVRLRTGLPAAVGIRGLCTFAFFGVEAFLPYALTALRAQTPTAAGLVLTAATLTWTAGSWLQARLAPRWPRRRTIRLGTATMSAGIGLAGAVPWPGLPPWTGAVAWAVAGAGMGLAYPAISLTVLSEAEPGREGSASASMQVCDLLGVALGTGLAGAAVSLAVATGLGRSAGIAVIDGMGFAVALGAVAACSRLPRRGPVGAAEVAGAP